MVGFSQSIGRKATLAGWRIRANGPAATIRPFRPIAGPCAAGSAGTLGFRVRYAHSCGSPVKPRVSWLSAAHPRNATDANCPPRRIHAGSPRTWYSRRSGCRQTYASNASVETTATALKIGR